MSPPRTLVVEVGNSRWKAGLFGPGVGGEGAAGENAAAPAPAATLRVAHADDPAPLRAFLAEYAPGGLAAPPVWAGVNPAGAAALLGAWPRDLAPAPVELPRAVLDRLVENRTRRPDRVGTDRLLNALAAAALAPPDADFAAVADCGTATTVDRVALPAGPGGRPAFLGGAILPGAVLCVNALHAHTALLPAVDLWEDAPADGRDTEAAIRHGVLSMQAAAVDRLLDDACTAGRPRGGGPDCRGVWPVLTGGAAGLVAGRLRTTTPRVVPHLTLIGLSLAARTL